MKKLFKLNLCVFFLFVMIIMCSCNSSSSVKPVTNFSATVEIQSEKINLTGEFSNTYQGLMTFNVTEPETLKGLNYVFKNDELEISFEEINCSSTEAFLPNDNCIKLLFHCLHSLGKGEYICTELKDFQTCYDIETQDRTFKVYANKQNGIVNKIETESMSFVFKSQKTFEN